MFHFSPGREEGRRIETLEERVGTVQEWGRRIKALQEKWGPTYDAALEKLRKEYPLSPTQEMLLTLAAGITYSLGEASRVIHTALIPDYEITQQVREETIIRARKVYLSAYPLSPLEREVIARLPPPDLPYLI